MSQEVGMGTDAAVAVSAKVAEPRNVVVPEAVEARETAAAVEAPAQVADGRNAVTEAPAPAGRESAPFSATWTTVEVATSASTFAALRSEWDALLDRSDAGVFNAWEWLYPWFRRIGPDRELMILTARNKAGTLVGLMPLCIERRKVLGQVVRRVSFLGENHVGSDYLDVVAERGQEQALARAFTIALRDRRSEWDVLDLTDFAEGSATVEALREVFGKEAEVRVSERYICPFEPLDPAEAFDAFLKRTGRRDNYLRRRKWLEKQPGYRIEKTVVPGALAAPMADFLRLHAMRWAGDGGSQGIKGPSVEAFHRDATQYLAERGQLRLYTMRLGDQALASVYGIVHGAKFIYFQSGYDPEWRNKSVGLVLVGETFKDAFELGLREYDFLRGTETYKSDWTTQQRKTVAVRVLPATGPGRWMEQAEQAAKQMRDLAKWALPTNLVEKIRRLRRKRAAI